MLAGLYKFLNSKSRATRQVLLVAAAVVAVGAVTAGALAGLTDQAAFVGSPAGLVLFTVALAWRDTVASQEFRAKTDIRAHVPLPRRRFAVGVSAALFAILVLLVGPHVPVVAAGTVVVFVAATLVVVFRATAEETVAGRARPERP